MKKKWYDKFFVDGIWSVAYKKLNEGEIVDYRDMGAFNRIPNDKRYWFADPIPYADENGSYLFVEACEKSKNKGIIGFFDIRSLDRNEKPKFYKVIEEPFHMSFPYVFRLGKEYYMLPETSESGKLILYKAVRFPYEWECEKILASNVKYVDTVSYTSLVDKRVKILTYEMYTDKMYLYNLKDDCTIELVYAEKDIERRKRGAGLIYEEDGHLYRPSQVCKNDYGESININQIEADDSTFMESLEYNIGVDNFSFIDEECKMKIHTISRTSDYIFIDYYKYYFNLFKLFTVIYKKIVDRLRTKRL